MTVKWCFLCLVLALPLNVAAETVVAAVAANFAAPMKELTRLFEQESGHRVTLVYGSSGKLFAQISHGAPFDVFLSADEEKPRALEEAGLAVAGSRFTYAQGRLVLWSARPELNRDAAGVLERGAFERLAIANPDLAPYGRAATEVLGALGLAAATEGKLVRGENIAQTYQFVSSGNAELGFVALAQVIALETAQKPGEDWREGWEKGWIVPDHLHRPIRQQAALLTAARENAAAHALMAFLRSPAGEEVIRTHGYHLQNGGD